jgi:(p)ppGpp synthase/HD superfamily hydrolase
MTYAKETKNSFLERLYGRLTPSEILQVRTAYMLAKHAHRAQRRKETSVNGDPLRYFEHVRRVALILMDSTENWSANNVCVALLHDTIEDTKDVDADVIEHIFGKEVCQDVLTLTKDKWQNYQCKLRNGSVSALVVKVCDRLDNVRSLRAEEVGEEFRDKQRKETREVYLPLFDEILGHIKEIRPILDELRELSGFNEI